MADERLWITSGDLDLADYILQRIDEVGAPADVDLMVTAAGVKDVRRLAEAKRTGVIGELRLILDAGTLKIRSRAKDGQRSNAHDIEDAVGAEAVRCIRVHAKAGRIAGADGEHAFVTSANLNRNNRPEQYETTDDLGPILEEVFGAVFDRVPPGCANPHGAAAYQGLGEALDQLERPGLVVYRPSRAMPVHQLASMDPDQIVIVERAGVGELLDGLLDLAGVCTVRASTWRLGRGDVHVLGAALVDGRVTRLDVALPSLFGRRASNADGYHAAMGLIPTHLRWSPSHAKILVVRGERETFVVTGGCNFANQGQLDIIRVRRGDEGLADLADELLDELPSEDPPPPPSTLQVQTARRLFERTTRRTPPAVKVDPDAPLDDREREIFLAACTEMKINPEDLPPGLTPRDIIESAQAAPEDPRKRGPGRPRKSDPVIPWTEVHDLLVYGEEYVDEAGARRFRYPGVKEIARRYGCAKSTVQQYVKKHDIERRRAEVKQEEDAIVAQHVIHERAADRAALHEKVDRIAHLLADRYLEGLMAPRTAPNHIRVDSINDVKQGVELAQKLGAAANGDGGRDEVKLTLTIEGLRERHKKVAARRRVTAAAAIGLVEEDDSGVIDVTPTDEREPIPVGATTESLAAGRPVDPQVALRRLGVVEDGDEDDDPWSDDL